MSEKEDKERENAREESGRQQFWMPRQFVSDIDLLFNTSFIFLHHLALRYLIFNKVRFSTFDC